MFAYWTIGSGQKGYEGNDYTIKDGQKVAPATLPTDYIPKNAYGLKEGQAKLAFFLCACNNPVMHMVYI
ncbi:hypothetical protein EJQ19_17000 [Paenibacillus whitsoniae]|uniref:Uncharacterized protein n=1 Tax=Paenibacillus whitsoniae TaxID=2496558 RepID=A0A3S0A3C2_9BACL|nr:hypothetical protein EJQ19_17000 [Paenibacillus whitsoniae]